MKILVLNGPNLNLLGKREPDIYGTLTLEDIQSNTDTDTAAIRHAAIPGHNIELHWKQSNCEGEIVTLIQQYGFQADCIGLVINPGAYAHYSVAIRDAIAAVPAPVVEVHISNIYAREDFRHNSVTAPVCIGVITGMGAQGYAMAVSKLCQLTKNTLPTA